MYTSIEGASKKIGLIPSIYMIIDAKEFERIYDEFARKIYKYCFFRVSSKEEAEDISALVFIRAWDHASAGKRVDSVQAFLYRIASNLIIDHYRKGRERMETTLDDPSHQIDIEDRSPDLAVISDRELLLKTVRKNIALLPGGYGEVIVLRYFNDLSVKEIAEILKTKENNISVRLHRGIEKLKKMISK